MGRVLVVGSGGREHALATRFNQSPSVETVYIAPGSPCMDDVATLVDIDALDFEALKVFALKHAIDLVVVGPEIPLVQGIQDAFKDTNICVFGPSKYCANLEGSKAFAKEMMKQANIKTAGYETFDDVTQAIAYAKTKTYPLVLKASGLAAGKGVVIVNCFEDAESELHHMMTHNKFEDAGNVVVIEDFLEGEEFSYLCLVSHDTIIPLQVSQDHKRAFDHDEGPNTGGMGAYTPVDSITDDDLNCALNDVVKPIVSTLLNQGHPYTGVLYAGLMKTKDGIQVIEFNVRFGDPETEVLMLALESDLYQVIMDLMSGEKTELQWTKDYVIGAVLASQGYPDAYQKGAVIKGLETLKTPVFHMGTTRNDHGVIAIGGRVLFVTARADTLQKAQAMLYQEIDKIDCDALFYRRDIGFHNS